MATSVLLASVVVLITVKTYNAATGTVSAATAATTTASTTTNPNFCKIITLTESHSYEYIQSHSGYDSTTNYFGNHIACWIVQTFSKDHVVKLSSDRNLFNVQKGTASCDFDKLEVQDLTAASHRSINFCGEDPFSSIHSSGQFMLIRFTTDTTVQCIGFKLRVQHVAKSHFNVNEWNSNNYFYGQDSGSCYDNTATQTTEIIAAVFGPAILILVVVFGSLMVGLYYKKIKKSTVIGDSNTRHEAGPRLQGVTSVTTEHQ